jgi:hypothetical protein
MALRLLTGGAVAVVAVGSILPTIWTTPDFDVPFPCGQAWIGATRTSHNPPMAIDFNRHDDEGDAVVASAAGTVTIGGDHDVRYGRHVVIDHGRGWTTRYAHLSTVVVADGQVVAEGEPIGEVGSTGLSTAPHLHYEQRYRDRAVRVVFDARESPTAGVRTYQRAGC